METQQRRVADDERAQAVDSKPDNIDKSKGEPRRVSRHDKAIQSALVATTRIGMHRTRR